MFLFLIFILTLCMAINFQLSELQSTSACTLVIKKKITPYSKLHWLKYMHAYVLECWLYWTPKHQLGRVSLSCKVLQDWTKKAGKSYINNGKYCRCRIFSFSNLYLKEIHISPISVDLIWLTHLPWINRIHVHNFHWLISHTMNKS